MKQQAYYSINGEDFYFEAAEDAVREMYDDEDIEINDKFTIYRGESRLPLASEFLPDIVDLLHDRAYDELSENADGWDFTKEQRKSLQFAMEDCLDKWAHENNMHPNFWFIEDIQEIKGILIDETGNFDII